MTADLQATSEQQIGTIPGPAGNLEALFESPDPATAQPVTAIICHPEESDGGSMHSKVVQIIERAQRELGAHTIRFNFRGVGQSEGEPSGDLGASEDLLAVIEWVRTHRPDHKIWLGGYGIGAFISARVAQTRQPEYLVSVASPVDRRPYTALERPQCPWLVIHGRDDEEINADLVEEWAQSVEPPLQFIMMEETNHDFHRKLMDLRGVIKNGIRRFKRASREEEE